MLNVGNHRPVELMSYIETLERVLGKRAQLRMLPLQAGDVPSTNADIDALRRLIDFEPKIPVEVGIRQFVDWYRQYFDA